MTTGESPYQCARREIEEEIGLQLKDEDLHCFGYISEQSYEGSGHWLMFLFNCRKVLFHLPEEIKEGQFGFFSRAAMDACPIAETDRVLLWPYYDRYSNGFVGIRANCAPNSPLRVVEELTLPRPQGTGNQASIQASTHKGPTQS